MNNTKNVMKRMKNLLTIELIAMIACICMIAFGGIMTVFAVEDSNESTSSISSKVDKTETKQEKSAIDKVTENIHSVVNKTTTQVTTTKITTVTTTVTTTTVTTTTKKSLKKSDEINLENIKVYCGSADNKSVGTESGKFFIYDGKDINGKIRITSQKEYCGKEPISEYVTFYVNKKDLDSNVEEDNDTSTSVSSNTNDEDDNDTSNNSNDSYDYTEETDSYYEDEEETSVGNEDTSDSDYSGSTSYSGNFTATFYDNIGCGYTDGSSVYGASGNILTEGRSVASCYFEQGTTLYIEGSGLDGYYTVEDKNTDGSIIDFYYQNRADIPDDFWTYGVMPITVSVVE